MYWEELPERVAVAREDIPRPRSSFSQGEEEDPAQRSSQAWFSSDGHPW